MVNAIFMAGTALLVVFIIIILLEISGESDTGRIAEKRIIALSLGILFAVHPVQTFLVLYIWQRMALLSAFFYCAAFLAYLVTRSGKFRPIWFGYLICSVMFVPAIASKENAVTLPAIILLAEIAFFNIGWKTTVKRIVLLGGILLFLLGIFTFLERPHGDIARDSGIMATIRQYYIEGQQTPAQVIMNQCRMVFSYLTLILFPIPDKDNS